jgi:hypothetical protein
MATSSWRKLPVEVKGIVMSHTSDIASLLNLITLDASTNSNICLLFPKIIAEAIANFMPFELQQIVLTLFFLREAGKVPNTEIDKHLQHGLDFKTWLQGKRFPVLIEILKEMLRLQKAVEYLTRTFARCVCQSPRTSSYEVEPALTTTEIHRIHRALWRLQTCCELSSSWTPSGDITLAQSGSDDRIPRLMIYFRKFHAWELEELHCVYEHLQNVLHRDAQDPRLESPGNRIHPFTLPAPRFHSAAPGQIPPGVKAKIISQGLVFLHSYLRFKPSWSRMSMEHGLFFPCDEFILPAIRELKNGRGRFSIFSEAIISSSIGPWTDTPDVASMANLGWRFFIEEHDLALHDFAYLRQFGCCIWDEQRLRSWGVLNISYGSGMNRKLQRIENPWVGSDERLFGFN